MRLAVENLLGYPHRGTTIIEGAAVHTEAGRRILGYLDESYGMHGLAGICDARPGIHGQAFAIAMAAVELGTFDQGIGFALANK